MITFVMESMQLCISPSVFLYQIGSLLCYLKKCYKFVFAKSGTDLDTKYQIQIIPVYKLTW